MSDGDMQQVNDLDVGLLANECHAKIEKVMGHHLTRTAFNGTDIQADYWVDGMYSRVDEFHKSWLAFCNAVVPVDISRRG